METRLGNDSTALAADSTATFTMNPNEPHYFLLVYATDSVSSNQLLFNVAKFNFSNFLVKDFDLEIMTFNEISILLVKGFNNFDELVHYRKVMADDPEFAIPDGVRPVMISTRNFDLLLQGRTFEEYFNFFDNYYNPENDEEPYYPVGR